MCYDLNEGDEIMLQERLKLLIDTLGIKKRDFAERIHFSQAYISMILNGSKTNPSDLFFDSVQREFRISVSWLKDGEGEMFLVDEARFSPIERNLIFKYNSLPLSKRKIVDEVLDALLFKQEKQLENSK